VSHGHNRILLHKPSILLQEGRAPLGLSIRKTCKWGLTWHLLWFLRSPSEHTLNMAAVWGPTALAMKRCNAGRPLKMNRRFGTTCYLHFHRRTRNQARTQGQMGLHHRRHAWRNVYRGYTLLSYSLAGTGNSFLRMQVSIREPTRRHILGRGRNLHSPDSGNLTKHSSSAPAKPRPIKLLRSEVTACKSSVPNSQNQSSIANTVLTMLLCCENHNVTHEYTAWARCRLLNVKSDGTHSYQCAFNA
jgi:hypothetical protein